MGSLVADKYVVERALGSGGVGVVMVARHRELGQRVAIKYLREAGLKNPAVAERFCREALIAAQIRSEHVVRVQDVGEMASAPFIVMEYLEGRDLGHFIGEGPITTAQAVDYVLQTCEGLAEIHALGIIHRDLKPENLFVVQDRARGPVVKIIDFGISKVTPNEGNGSWAPVTCGDCPSQHRRRSSLSPSPGGRRGQRRRSRRRSTLRRRILPPRVRRTLRPGCRWSWIAGRYTESESSRPERARAMHIPVTTVDSRIDELQRKAAATSCMVVLAGGLPAAELFPRAELAQAFLEVLAEPQCSALQYGWPEGDPALREHVAAALRARGAHVTASDVIVTSGAQQALGIAMDHLGAHGRRVALDPQTYPVALDMLRTAKARPVRDPERADWIYAMPGVTNPAGSGMSAHRREAILASGAPVIADEAYAELRFDGKTPRPIVADARDRTWHVGTLSKSLSPGLRVGWLVPPPSERDAALEAKRRSDLEAGTLAQTVVRTFLARDNFDLRLARARSFYCSRADALASAVRRWLPSWRFAEPEGGFSIYLETDLEGDDAGFLERAIREGVSFDPGRSFLRDGVPSFVTMRLCFSQAEPAALEEGVRRLARAARSMAASRGLASV